MRTCKCNRYKPKLKNEKALKSYLRQKDERNKRHGTSRNSKF